MRASLYADDTAIFINPIESELQTTTQIILNFGEASGLRTNFQKSMVLSISCDHIDLNTILQGFLAIQASFPIKYLGLPLTHKRLCRVDF